MASDLISPSPTAGDGAAPLERTNAEAADRVIEGVLVVGGGYAGVHAARAAQRQGVPATVLDPTGRYDFVPRLAAVAGGTAPVGDAFAPLTDLVDRVEIGTAASIGDGVVTLTDGSTWSADAVVVTAGAEPTSPPIEGIERAWPLRTSGDALALRDAIATATSVVVVGGGATGVQLAGSIAHRHDADVSLVEAGSALLPELSDLGHHALRILRDRNVDVRLDAAVDRIDDYGVVFESGDRIDGLVVWAAGFEARADELAVEVDDDGTVIVDDQMRVDGMHRTFAAGDVAQHLDDDGQPLPMSAQIAVQAGSVAGANAARHIKGDKLERGSLAQRGWVLDLGGWRGLARVGPFTIAAPPLDRLAPLLHAAIDIKHLLEVGGLRTIWAYRPGAGDAERDPTT